MQIAVCMGMQKMDAANACGYLQPRYAFYNLQHIKKNLLIISHEASAFHKEKCMPALLPYKIDTEIHGQLEREIWPHYVYGHEKYICMPICIID
jgi:hypothetical protein